jgi:hypothetical protein
MPGAGGVLIWLPLTRDYFKILRLPNNNYGKSTTAQR